MGGKFFFKILNTKSRRKIYPVWDWLYLAPDPHADVKLLIVGKSKKYLSKMRPNFAHLPSRPLRIFWQVMPSKPRG